MRLTRPLGSLVGAVPWRRYGPYGSTEVPSQPCRRLETGGCFDAALGATTLRDSQQSIREGLSRSTLSSFRNPDQHRDARAVQDRADSRLDRDSSRNRESI